MTPLAGWIGALSADAETALAAEKSFRADFARRVAELAELRAEAFRRANLMAALSDAISDAEDEDDAVGRGQALLRRRLGWESESEARAEITQRFAPVCAACFLAQAEQADAEAPPPDPAAALAAFEAWFRETRGGSFWALFEVEIPETPLVDF